MTCKKKNEVSKIHEQPKRQSKAGEWLDAHPGGIGYVVDWRAVNK